MKIEWEIQDLGEGLKVVSPGGAVYLICRYHPPGSSMEYMLVDVEYAVVSLHSETGEDMVNVLNNFNYTLYKENE